MKTISTLFRGGIVVAIIISSIPLYAGAQSGVSVAPVSQTETQDSRSIMPDPSIVRAVNQNLTPPSQRKKFRKPLKITIFSIQASLKSLINQITSKCFTDSVNFNNCANNLGNTIEKEFVNSGRKLNPILVRNDDDGDVPPPEPPYPCPMTTAMPMPIYCPADQHPTSAPYDPFDYCSTKQICVDNNSPPIIVPPSPVVYPYTFKSTGFVAISRNAVAEYCRDYGVSLWPGTTPYNEAERECKNVVGLWGRGTMSDFGCSGRPR